MRWVDKDICIAVPAVCNVGCKNRDHVEVLNVHERVLEADPIQVGALVDSLSSEEDRLWPGDTWPRMAFDRPLSVGAIGGHGPIRYFVEAYIPGKSIKFRFTGPKGFDGYHSYEIIPVTERSAVLGHTLKMSARGLALLSWPLVYRPMHDALLEDSLATAQRSLGMAPQVQGWSVWVKVLRWVISGGKARSQNQSNNASNPDGRNSFAQ